MNKIKIDNYYKPESKTLRLDEIDYTIIPNSDIKPLLDKLQQENKILKENAENNDKVVDKVNWENQLLKKENKQLKEQLLVTQTNEETFRLEMKDITQTLGLDEDTIFDDVKAYVRILKDNWNELKEYIRKNIIYDDVGMKILDPSPLEDYMQELEQGSDNNDSN